MTSIKTLPHEANTLHKHITITSVDPTVLRVHRLWTRVVVGCLTRAIQNIYVKI